MKINPFLLACGVLAIIGGATAVTAWYFNRSSNLCVPGQVAGGDIGGPFELISETGETVTDADIITRPSLVYFGYTYCPDVCPLDVARNADAIDLLTERGVEAQSVFITVDPERDTPDHLAGYTDNFQESMIGLSGSAAQIQAAVDAYRVRVQMPDDRSDPYYIVGHSNFTYLMLPETGFVDFFHGNATAEQIADRVACSVI